MNRRIVKIAAACALSIVFATGARAAGGAVTGDVLKGDFLPRLRNTDPIPFKMRAGGQIDLSTFEISFAGHASHFGQFTATGQLDPSTGNLAGTITVANGDIVNWTGVFQPGPLGEIEATLTFHHGTGRFGQIDGSASGPVALEPDFMFSFRLEGSFSFVDLGF